MNVLIWFKRDLRISDHPALTHAAGLGAVLPLYIVEPDYWALPDTSARQWAFTAECLEDLRGALADLGAPLLVRVGDAQTVLERICRQHNITRIISHAEVGNAFTLARNQRIAAWAAEAGIWWQELPQPLASDAAPALPAPLALNVVPGLVAGQIPNARALRLADDSCGHRQRGGRSQALDLLDSFLQHRSALYQAAQATPLLAERACSRLSPHFAQGTVSVREVVQAPQPLQADVRWSRALNSFRDRLRWRGQSLDLLSQHPELINRYHHAPAELLRRSSDPARLAAWQNAETGLPFLDACLRYLAATGWLSFRARALVIGFASYHLWLDWRVCGAVLARRLTDYDPGLHWPQVQIQSGTMAAQPPRIPDPIRQAALLDPSGTFTRRWVPELSAVPDHALQTPWRWNGAKHLLGRRYPEPVVDIASAQRLARTALLPVYPSPSTKADQPLLIEPTTTTLRPLRRSGSPGQLTLDL